MSRGGVDVRCRGMPHLILSPPLTEYKVCICTAEGRDLDVGLYSSGIARGIDLLLRNSIFWHNAKYLTHVIYGPFCLPLDAIPKRLLRVDCLKRSIGIRR